MKKEYNKGFTLIELIIVMVLLGILAAVAVPRMSNTIESAEEAVEGKFMANLVSAIEIYAGDKVVENSVKSYPDNPFNALEVQPDNQVWSFSGMPGMGGTITHYRNGYDSNADPMANEGKYKTWSYYVYYPGSMSCQTPDNPSNPHGCYTLSGPGYGPN